MAPEMGFVIGVDLGATTTRMAVANVVGAEVALREVASDARGGHHLVAQLQGLKDDLLAAGGVPAERILLAAVATPGVVDPVTGTLSLAPNISDIGGFDLAAALTKTMG
ncbi:ROK family protein, partial [Mycobacterium tuberculosis]|nr:ROK family protein [Mycobacterium tuberculosis]